uniref:RxLR effector candidate protein n=1 Tax=Hyaloperonospora arabidopsidis (strain Emoy2) TaxID=559515 RepID=M4BIT5_HYAAE
MTHTRSVVLLAGLALSSSVALQVIVDPLDEAKNGSPRPMAVNDVAFLTTTACHPSLYGAGVTNRICFTDFLTVKTLDGGVLNRFQVRGCPVNTEIELGYCRDGVCPTTSAYEVVIYSEPWSALSNVPYITEIVQGPSEPAPRADM